MEPVTTGMLGAEETYTTLAGCEEDTTQAMGEECWETTEAIGEEGDPPPPAEGSVSGPFGGF